MFANCKYHLGGVQSSAAAILVAIMAFWALSVNAVVAQAHPGDKYVEPSSPFVRERLEWFKDQKLCLMMHFGLYSIWGLSESWPLSTKDAFWARADVEWTKDDTEFKRQYWALNRCFNPVRFNAKEIAKTAKRCGFRYIAFTTKHHDGFCLWDTKFTDYKTTAPECPYSANPNADIVKSLFDACRAEGLGISCYFSKADWHHDDFWEGAGIGRFTSRYPTYSAGTEPERWNRFKAFTKNQILELVGNYGPIDILWLDGAWLLHETGWDMGISDIVDAARKIQPNLISVDRAAKNEYMDIRTPEQTVPAEPLDYPWESCITMSDNWAYHCDDAYKSTRQLVHLIVDVVSKGGNLALNVGPMPDGRIPHPAMERLEKIGRWLAKNGAAIYGTRVAKVTQIKSWRYTQGKDGRLFAVRLWSEGDRNFSHMLLNMDEKYGKVMRVTHLASGAEIPFLETVGDYQRGVTLALPHGFLRDEFADAFAVEVKQTKGTGQCQQ